MKITKQNRKAFAILLVLVFSLLFSSVYMILEAEHDCTGEDCPVCAALLQCEENLLLYKFIFAAAVHLIFLLPAAFGSTEKPAIQLRPLTPISLKVQLNN